MRKKNYSLVMYVPLSLTMVKENIAVLMYLQMYFARLLNWNVGLHSL